MKHQSTTDIEGASVMNSFRQTPHKDFLRVSPVERFGHRDRWNGSTEPRKPSFKVLATLFAFTGIGVLALAD
ncbi:MAG: hypothetical protein EOP73_16365 [Variovorax sp.]|jgi:hypothetical protein|nr:MAG: hypothetical protein EOP73_16365 [Variovorax sp.]